MSRPHMAVILACLLSVWLPSFPAAGGGGVGGSSNLSDPVLSTLLAGTFAPGAEERAQVQNLPTRIHPQLARGETFPTSLPVLLRYEGSEEALLRSGFRTLARLGTVRAGLQDPVRLEALANLIGLSGARLSPVLSAFPFANPDFLRPLEARPGLSPTHARVSPVSGEGVLIAFVDTGVDIHHWDFRKPDGTTRIKYLLDLSDPGDTDWDGDLDGVGPFGGTLYTEAQINAALLGTGSLREHDSTGHGTHGLSVAAGGDPSRPGLAPGADLLVVKATRVDGSLGFWAIDIVSALAFVKEKADELGQPCVVNLSLGTLFASHDGWSLEEQAVDVFSGPGIPGRVAVIAAGNASDNRGSAFRHFRGSAFAGVTAHHTLTIPPYTPNAGKGNDRALLDVWYASSQKLTLTVTTPSGQSVSAPFGTYADVQTPDGDIFIANMGTPDPSNGDMEAVILVDDWSGSPPAPGAWIIGVTGEDAGSGFYDAWLVEESAVGNTQPFLSANADNARLVAQPGTAFSAITVGSFARHSEGTRFLTQWTDVNGILRLDTTALPEDISEFSSPGPTRDGRTKPDLCAPGERVVGAVSRDAWPGVSPASIYQYHPFAEPDALMVDATPDAAYGALQGTSFSTPVVTGVAARILSARPELDAIGVRNIILNPAVADGFTGAVPNGPWGFGKVDLTLGTGALPDDLRIGTDTLPDGALGEPYGTGLEASGGRKPYSWSIASGTLPPGLSLDGSRLSGTPSASGEFSFTLSASDASSPQQSNARVYSLRVLGSGPLTPLTSALPSGHVDRAYSAGIEASGGTEPYTWSLVGGSLPTGLALSGNRITGTPDTVGRYAFTLSLHDAGSQEVLVSLGIRIRGLGTGDWNPLGIIRTTVNHIAVDERTPAHLACSTENAFDNSQDAVFESWDAGESWRPISINNGFNTTADWLGIDPAGGTLWALRKYAPDVTPPLSPEVCRYDEVAGVWVDTDACDSYSPDLDVSDFDASGAIYVSSFTCSTPSGALRKSSDGGSSWTTLGVPCGGYLRSLATGSLSVFRPDPSLIFATRAGLTDPGLLHYSCTSRSTDGGMTWTEIGAQSTGEYHDVQVSQSDPLDVVRASYKFPDVVFQRSTDGGQSWSEFEMPYMGFYRTMRRSPSDPSALILAGDMGLFRSVSSGTSWSELTLSEAASPDFSALAFHPADPQTFYVGSSEGLHLTEDGGSTWTLRSRGLVRRGVAGMALSPTRPDELLLGTTSGEPYLSRSGGARWMTPGQRLGAWQIFDPAISAADPDLYLILVHMEGLWRSTDRGISWQKVAFPPSCTYCWSANAVAADPFNPENLLVGVIPHDIYRSTDRGGTWTRVGVEDVFANPKDLAYAFDVPGRVFAAMGYSGLYRSEDGGATWFPESGGAPEDAQVVLPAPSNSGRVYAAFGSAIYFRNPSTGSWTESQASPPEPVLSLAVDWADPLLAYSGCDHPGTVGGTGGLYRTRDGGGTWQHLPSVLDSYDVVSVLTHPTKRGLLYAATAEGGAFRTEDGGTTWEALDQYGTVADTVNVILPDPGNRFLLYAGTEGYGVQASPDGGKTFTSKNTGLSEPFVNALAFQPGSSSILFAATDRGLYRSTNAATSWTITGLLSGEVVDLVTDSEGSVKRIWAVVKGEGIARSLDGGSTFTLFMNGLSSLDLTGVEIENRGTVKRIWAVMRGGEGVAYSDDLGETWQPAAGNGLTDRNLNDLTIQTGTVKRIWAVADTGVFFTSDAGDNWTEISAGLPSGVPVTSASVDPRTGELFLGLGGEEGGGIYRGGNLTGSWTEFSSGLDEPRVRRVTNDGGHSTRAAGTATTFFAATLGNGAYESEVSAPTSSSPAISTASLPTCIAREAYSATLLATGGTPPYIWSLSSGALPAGLTLNSSGSIGGQAVLQGRYDFSVRVTDAYAKSAEKSFEIVVALEADAADLRLTLTDTPDPVGVSRTLVYTFAVANGGPSHSGEAVLQVLLPEDAGLISATGPHGLCSADGRTVTCPLGSLPPDSSIAAHVQVSPSKVGTLRCTASVTSPVRDPVPENNSVVESTHVVEVPPMPGDCDGSGEVSIGEVQKAINMFLGLEPPGCGVDCSGDGTVSIGEVQKVINAFLGSASSC